MMTAGARLTAGFSPLRLRNAALVVVAFAGPCLIGAPAPYVLLLLALLGYLTPSIRRSFSERTRNPVDLMLLLPVLALLATFAIATKAPADLRYLLNFLPLLVALPYRWQLEGEARHDGLAVLATLALAGAGLALLVGVVQVFALGVARAGHHWLNPIQFADTAMLLGFLSVAGAWLPGTRHRWIYLAGPLFGIAATILAGTRGAMLAVPAARAAGDRLRGGRCTPEEAGAADLGRCRGRRDSGRGTPPALCGTGAGLGVGATDHPRPQHLPVPRRHRRPGEERFQHADADRVPDRRSEGLRRGAAAWAMAGPGWSMRWLPRWRKICRSRRRVSAICTTTS